MSKHLGLVAEMRFELAATLHGLTVSRPSGDNSPYDFIVDTGKDLLKVQVKSSGYSQSPGSISFNLGQGASGKHLYKKLEVHYFALYMSVSDIFFLIPYSLLAKRLTVKLTVDGKFSRFKENWNLKA